MNRAIAQHPVLSQALGLILIMRPRQWIKNGFVLAPLLFAGEFLHEEAVAQALLATLLFCIASSATYIVNDISDLEADRRHPKKSKSRPLAAGIVSLPAAIGLLIALYGVLVGAWFVTPAVVSVIGCYLALNVAYTFVLKHQPVVDIFTIALGFVLRVVAGAVALSVPVSEWMFVTTLCLALYLAAVKRKQELAQSGSEGRRVLAHYSPALVDRYAEMAGIGAVVFYSLFVMEARPGMVMTVPVVLFGLFRYWYVVETLDGGESPTDALLSDWPLAAAVVVWIALCGWALWPVAAQ